MLHERFVGGTVGHRALGVSGCSVFEGFRVAGLFGFPGFRFRVRVEGVQGLGPRV